MGVFNKTPYTNFHELNLNWIIKKIKEVAADNAFFKQFFKTIEDEHILGVVTKVTENNDNTVKTDYLNEDTQQMDNYIAYNKTGTDGAISGAVTPVSNRVTSAEGRLDSAETNINTLATTSIHKNVNIGSTKIIDFIHDTTNGQGHYILNVQNAPDNPAGQGNTCTVVLFKPQAGGAYSYLYAFRPGKLWVCYSSITVNTQYLYWYQVLPETGTGFCKLPTGTILLWGTITHGGGANDILTLPTAVSGIDSIVATPVYTGGTLTPVFIVPDIRDLTSIKMYVRDYANNNVTSTTLQYKWYAIAH